MPTRLVVRLDVHRPHLPAVLPGMQVCPGAVVRVIEAQPRGSRRERDAPHPVRRNVRRAFFRRAVYVGGYELPMPVQLLRRVHVIVDLDRYFASCFEPQQWSRELSVVSDRRDDVFRRNLDCACANVQCIVRGHTLCLSVCRSNSRLPIQRHSGSRRRAEKRGAAPGRSCRPQKLPPR